ncbi:MAG: alpha/beta hydrolase [Pseudomonadota bacterium]
MFKRTQTSDLDIAYLESGDPLGTPAIMLHGFPYDVRSYAEVAPILARAGLRVIVPYLRGYGPTTFRSEQTLRSGEQAVLGNDLREFMDSLDIGAALLGGYDWGGRAACIVSALWPDRSLGLVSCNGYNMQNIARANAPAHPEIEHRYWYQYYFHSERGRAGLAKFRYDYCKLLWQLWSPNWQFDDDTYAASAASFDNPDFVDVVIHSYRHRYGLVAGDDRVATVEAALAAQPDISVPTIAIDGAGDGVMPPEGCTSHARHFSGPYERRVIPLVGHNVPQEAPEAFAEAVLDLHARL